MKAVLKDHQIAASDDIVETGGYAYFSPASVRREWLEPSPRTADDLKCPHGVRFYDVVVDGERHRPQRVVLRVARSPENGGGAGSLRVLGGCRGPLTPRPRSSGPVDRPQSVRSPRAGNR